MPDSCDGKLRAFRNVADWAGQEIQIYPVFSRRIGNYLTS
jgi:hypothetical protein